MALTSRTSAYDDRSPGLFEEEKALLGQVFGRRAHEIHHVGSTAIPGLSAKPEIDILIISHDIGDEELDRDLARLGYVRRKDLSDGHGFYRRDRDGIRSHKLHLCRVGHWQISRMLRFRDILRQDDALRRRYQILKLQLEATNTSGMGEYLAQKAPFIDAMVGPPPDI